MLVLKLQVPVESKPGRREFDTVACTKLVPFHSFLDFAESRDAKKIKLHMQIGNLFLGDIAEFWMLRDVLKSVASRKENLCGECIIDFTIWVTCTLGGRAQRPFSIDGWNPRPSLEAIGDAIVEWVEGDCDLRREYEVHAKQRKQLLSVRARVDWSA